MVRVRRGHRRFSACGPSLDGVHLQRRSSAQGHGQRRRRAWRLKEVPTGGAHLEVREGGGGRLGREKEG